MVGLTGSTVEDLEKYSQKKYGHPLPSIIDSHRVIDQYDAPQLSSPSSAGMNPAYHDVNNGIHINHGWKIHADLVADQEYEEALASIGRNSDLSIANRDLAETFDKRLNNLGMDADTFLKHFETFGLDTRNGNTKYLNPHDLVSAMEVFEKNQVTYKMSALTYGQGRHITAYPQSLVNRDALVTDLESALGERLVDQNNPAYRASLGLEIGTKNHPISRGVSGRFTTDYLTVNPETGKVDYSLSASDGALPDEYKISGKISKDEIEKINKTTAELPEMAELLHGPEGYISPYRTIEQIAEDRVSGAINPSHTKKRLDSTSEYGIMNPQEKVPIREPLPPINKPNNVTTIASSTEQVEASIDRMNPSTWKNLGPDQILMEEGGLPVKESVAAQRKHTIYRNAAHNATNAAKDDVHIEGLRKPALSAVENEISSGWHSGSGVRLGYEGRPIPKTGFAKNYNEVMADIYKDISEGVDPIKAAEKHIHKLDVPDDIRDTIITRIKEEVADTGKQGVVTRTPYRQLTEDEYTSRFNDTKKPEDVARSNAERVEPLNTEYDTGSKAAELTETKPAPTTPTAPTKPAPTRPAAPTRDRPTISVGEKSDIGTVIRADRAEATGATARTMSTAGKTEAKVAEDAAAVAARTAAEAAAKRAEEAAATIAARSTRGAATDAMKVAEHVTAGHLGAAGLALAGLAAVIGLSKRKHHQQSREY